LIGWPEFIWEKQNKAAPPQSKAAMNRRTPRSSGCGSAGRRVKLFPSIVAAAEIADLIKAVLTQDALG
jgi:hypothetical protein